MFSSNNCTSFQVTHKLNFCLQINMENFFVYFYSKKVPSEFLVEQQVASNEQRAKTNEQQATSFTSFW